MASQKTLIGHAVERAVLDRLLQAVRRGEGLDSFTLARMAWIDASGRRTPGCWQDPVEDRETRSTLGPDGIGLVCEAVPWPHQDMSSL